MPQSKVQNHNKHDLDSSWEINICAQLNVTIVFDKRKPFISTYSMIWEKNNGFNNDRPTAIQQVKRLTLHYNKAIITLHRNWLQTLHKYTQAHILMGRTTPLKLYWCKRKPGFDFPPSQTGSFAPPTAAGLYTGLTTQCSRVSIHVKLTEHNSAVTCSLINVFQHVNLIH